MNAFCSYVVIATVAIGIKYFVYEQPNVYGIIRVNHALTKLL